MGETYRRGGARDKKFRSIKVLQTLEVFMSGIIGHIDHGNHWAYRPEKNDVRYVKPVVSDMSEVSVS